MTDKEAIVTDFLVVGSGAGALCAALAARSLGANVVVLEKEKVIGGNSALSGGTMWIPANPLMAEEGIKDSIEEGLTYLDHCVGDDGPATSKARKRAYLVEGIRMIEFLREKGMRMRRVPDYADYYAELPGANVKGRALQCEVFDLNELGEYAALVPNLTPIVGYVEEFPQLSLSFRTWRGLRTLIRVIARTKWARRKKRAGCANGSALIGRLLQAVLDAGVEVRTEAPISEFIVEDERVVGIKIENGKDTDTYRVNRGILMASGGYARNMEMRKQYGRTPASLNWTFANPGETGDTVEMAIQLGAATELMDEAIWMPMTVSPEGPVFLEYERAKPHSIIVDGNGERYMDEGAPYMEVGQIMYERNEQMGNTIPSWLIMDTRHRQRYTFGFQLPGRTPEEWIRSGFMKRADSLAELAKLCNIDPDTLENTVSRFNAYSYEGIDRDFQRGETRFSSNFGDPRNRPNRVLGSIEKAPFYSVAIYPGDLGTFGGILTDEHGRVMSRDGSVLDGLYATGNCTAPVMGRKYPCTGASIASTMIFGFIAARHAMGERSDG